MNRLDTQQHKGRICWFTGLVILALSLLTGGNPGWAATAGLPFVEDFSNTTLKDATRTTANWSVNRRQLGLFWRYQTKNTYSGFTSMPDFGAASDYSAAVAAGDIDHDGDLDLVVGNTAGALGNPGVLNKIYMSNGDGTFAAPVNLNNATDHTFGILLVDFNRDGHLDVVTINYDETDKIYLGNGDGTFAATGTALGSETVKGFRAAVGDLNRDGKLDIVVAVVMGENLVYLGNGDGTFAAATRFGSSSDTTNQVALGDLDHDGDLDIVAVNEGSNHYYLNPGNGDFSTVTPKTLGLTGNGSLAVVLADINRDGNLDAVIGNAFPPASSSGAANKLFLGDGNGNFDAGTNIDSDNEHTHSIAVADIDSDGDLDIIAGDAVTRVYLNDGSGVFPQTGLELGAAGNSNYSIIAKDLDNDGDLDIALVNYDAAGKIYLSQADKLFSQTAANISAVSYWTYELCLKDFNGDGNLDLAIANGGEVNRLYLGNGRGGFDAGSDIGSETDQSYSLTCGDFNGDGNQDIVIGNFFGGINRIYLGNGDGTFTAPGNISSDTDNTFAMVSRDFNRDGMLDLAIANDQQANKVYLGKGDGTFGPAIVLGPTSSHSDRTMALVAGDLNNDGIADLVAGNRSSYNMVYLGNADGTFTDGVQIIDGAGYITCGLCLGDFDEDGNLDLATANYSDKCRIYLGNGDGSFAAGEDLDPSYSKHSWSIVCADFNGDGHLDLAIGNEGGYGDKNHYFLGRGDGTFTAANTLGKEDDDTISIVAGDIDKDGDLDLICADRADSNRIYFNNQPGIFAASRAIAPGTNNNTLGAALGDIDHDGDFDLVTANTNVPGMVYLGDPNGTFAATGSPVSPDRFSGQAVILEDFNEDGNLDAIYGIYNKPARIYCGAGDGTFNAGADIGNNNTPTRAVSTGDLDRDGHLDLVVGISGDANLIFFGKGDGTFTNTTREFGSNSNWSYGLVLADFDHDGDLDIVCANYGQNNMIFLNDGSGAFPTSGSSAISQDTANTRTVAASDLDGDGNLDLIFGNDSAKDRIFLGNGDGTFRNPGWDLGSDTATTGGLAVADFNRDGIADVAATHVFTADMVYYGSGGGRFADGRILADEKEPEYTILTADLDADGDSDLVAVNNSGAAANRIFFAGGYCDAGYLGQSLTTDNESVNIAEITLQVTTDTEKFTWLDWFLSNNGGGNWYRVEPDCEFSFPTSGSDLRWRVELSSLTPTQTPLITEVRLALVKPEIVSQAVFPNAGGAGLSARVEPHKLTTNVWFEWGLTTAYGNVTSSTHIGFFSAVDVHQTLAGLDANTVYHVRTVSASSAGTVYGDDMVFMTRPGSIGNCAHKPVRIDARGEFNTIENGFSSGSDGDTIKLWGAVISGDAELIDDIDITLQGGWNCDYSQCGAGHSTISGTLTISAGSLVIDKVDLQ